MLKMFFFRCAVLALPVLALHGQAPKQVASHPVHTRGWVETRLYFGLGPADTPQQGTPEASWRAFLDAEVTPRFPSGLSVQDIYGQWQSGSGARVQRLRSKVLILDYPATPSNAARIEAIRAAWKQRTGDVSVLRVTARADVVILTGIPADSLQLQMPLQLVLRAGKPMLPFTPTDDSTGRGR